MSNTDSTNWTNGPSYRPRTNPLHVWNDASATDSISTTVITAVARASSADPTEMPPLYEFIDPDALDKLIGSPFGDDSRLEGYVTFDYAGYSVTVYGDGEIVVHDLNSN